MQQEKQQKKRFNVITTGQKHAKLLYCISSKEYCFKMGIIIPKLV